MISQPRIAVLGLSQPYVFIGLAYWLLVVVVLGFEPYLQFKLRFKPSAYLYLRTSSKTKDRHLGLLQSLLSSKTRLLSFACQEALTVLILQGEPSTIVSCTRIKGVLVLKPAKWRYDLVPSRLVSIILLSPTCSHCITNCLSQAYGCSDRDNPTTMRCQFSGNRYHRNCNTALYIGLIICPDLSLVTLSI